MMMIDRGQLYNRNGYSVYLCNHNAHKKSKI